MNIKIVQKENKILRKIAKEVPVKDIVGTKIQNVIKKMMQALDSEGDGVAIAAPQIGENLRIFIISKKIFEIMDEEKERGKKVEDSEKSEKGKAPHKNMIFINPEILKTSKEKMLVDEGCLSVRWLYGKVKRSKKTLIRAYDENGKSFTIGGSGLLSQAFQHETDHLNGVLFIDKAVNLEEITPEKTNSIKQL